jgi:hypothetical protein
LAVRDSVQQIGHLTSSRLKIKQQWLLPLYNSKLLVSIYRPVQL